LSSAERLSDGIDGSIECLVIQPVQFLREVGTHGERLAVAKDLLGASQLDAHVTVIQPVDQHLQRLLGQLARGGGNALVGGTLAGGAFRATAGPGLSRGFGHCTFSDWRSPSGRPISPLEEEMSGRTEGGAKELCGRKRGMVIQQSFGWRCNTRQQKPAFICRLGSHLW
jgi:hypothetical protein